jgi:RNA polymerase sigma factor (sigma-70 family)
MGNMAGADVGTNVGNAHRQPMGQGENGDRLLSDLMRRAQDGDAVAYESLLSQVLPLLRRVVRRRCSALPTQDIEDIVQETLVSLHGARATYNPRRPFLPWAMAIARNRIADAARRRARRVAHEVTVERFDGTFSSIDANIPVNAYRDPEALQQAIRKLPQGQRMAIETLKLREMSLKEAAAMTGMSVSALKVAAHRAMKSLRAALG